MKITKTRLKEIIKEEVEKIVVNEVDVAQQGLAQARKDVASGVSPEEKEEVSNLTNMIIAFSKKRDLTKGRIAELIGLLKKEMSQQMSEGKRPPSMKKRTKADQGTLDAMGDKPPSDPDDKEYMKGYNDIVKFRGEEELDEMSAMSTGAVATSPKKEPLEENGWDEPVS